MIDLASLQVLLDKAFPLVVFLGMWGLCWRIINALDLALGRQQAIMPVPVPQPLPVSPPPPPIIEAKPATAASAQVVDPGMVNAIKQFEGYSAKPYWDVKQWTVGWGTKASGPNDVVTPEEAEKRLTAEIQVADTIVEHFAPNAPIGVKQALTSLTYNAGGAWEGQELGTLIKAGNYADAKAHFLAYNHSGGQVNPGLTTRREKEWGWVDHPL